ncbi:hypothetical protein EC973_007505 [Apophysomyces ossiformis]|uniref:Cytochrome P450 n=1 Tax=Apophysomyces ossiformis TaxID=679940 RepID=A0A8H7EPQ7_9FUNG|nr:hypothetical protein EC973_007505 [Apophysomyces ossiformis]
MGVQTWIIISDPEIAQDIFSARGSITSMRPYNTFCHEFYSKSGRGIAFGNPGKKWRKTRSAVHSIMTSKAIENFIPQIEYEAKSIVEQMISATETKQSIDPRHYLQLMSLNIILMVMVNRRAKSLEDPIAIETMYFIDDLFRETGATTDVSAFFPIMSIVDRFTGIRKYYEEIIATKRDPYIQRLIQQGLSCDKDCLVKALYSRKEEYGLDDTDLLVAFGDILIGATDTTATALTWSLAILSHHADVQKKIADEIDAFTKQYGRAPNINDRSAFPYTICVIKECLRTRSVGAFGVPHATSEDFEYKGYYIPKGATLLANLMELNRSPSRFDNPHAFYPERYANDNKSMSASAAGPVQERDHYTFGWGRRICPGINLAEAEIFMLFAQLFGNCTVEPDVDPQGQPIYPDIKSTVHSGLMAFPKSYNYNLHKPTYRALAD